MCMARKSSKSQSSLLRWMLAFSMVAILAAGTLTPHIGVPYQHVDKLVHWAAFCAIGSALLGPLSFTKTGTLAVLFFLAFVLEGGQAFVPGRTVSMGDLTANLFGMVCAFAFIQIGLIMRPKFSLAKADESRICSERAKLNDMIHLQPQPPLVAAILFGNAEQDADCGSAKTVS